MPASALPVYVAYGQVDSPSRLVFFQRTLELRGARVLRPPELVRREAHRATYAFTLVSNYAVLEFLIDHCGLAPQYLLPRVQGERLTGTMAQDVRRVWLPADRPRHLTGHDMDKIRRMLLSKSQDS